jgi:hypothetical protein
MLSVTYKPIMLNVFRLNVVILSIGAPLKELHVLVTKLKQKYLTLPNAINFCIRLYITTVKSFTLQSLIYEKCFRQLGLVK